MNAAPMLEVRDLVVTAEHGDAAVRLVDGVSFDIGAGETVGMVGSSGAGKTLTALALIGLLPPWCTAGGSVRWRGRELIGQSHDQLRAVRGAGIGFVPQDAMTSLHPLLRVDGQVAEAIRAHRPELRAAAALHEAGTLLQSMRVPRPPSGYAAYPFQWSGGMRQRALIAMAIAHAPALLIADEPTTALDLSTQAAVLELLRRAQRETGAAMLLITHDMAVVAQMTDRVIVMAAGGRLVEQGDIMSVRARPQHAETVRLMAVLRAGHAFDAPPQPPRPRAPEVLRVEHVSVRFAHDRRLLRPAAGWTDAVSDVGFSLRPGETIGIVGESGGGKSTLARALVGLERPQTGRVMVDGCDITRARRRALRSARAMIQLVFQDPASSLNPRSRIGASMAQPLHAQHRYTAMGGARRVSELLEMVGLPTAYRDRFPHELSGGERQRVAIARALALDPRILVLDEPVTSLDAAARDGIIRLLRELQAARGLAYVLIAHDLRLVRGMAHETVVMRGGRFVEHAPTASLFDDPQHDYTRELLALTPQCACCAVRLAPVATQ